MVVTLSDLISALDNDELTPCFQPVVELCTGRLVGFEVLARWLHPQRGLILPENFISLAVENQLIDRLMHQVFSKALLAGAVLPPPLILGLNVSPVQFRDPTLPDQIRDLANHARFPLDRVTIEFTESAVYENIDQAKKIATDFRALGCRLGLDDFGTGYSNLGHLQTLPFNVLKVDRSFISTLTSKRESRKIVASIIGLAHSLGITTVAEGIETENQADMLRCLGCEYGQGWLYGRATPADSLPAIVAASPGFQPVRLLSAVGGTGLNGGLEAQPTLRLAQLQAIYDGAPVALGFLDIKLRYVSLNQRLADLNGAPIADHIGKTVKEMIPDVYPTIEPYLLRALHGESFSNVEFTRTTYATAENQEITLYASYQAAFDETGEVIGVSVALVDITERKHAADALKESEDNLRHMVDLNPEMPWTMDPQGNNLDVSARWVQLTGLSKAQTRKLGWLDALHPDDVQPTLKVFTSVLRTGLPLDVEYRIKSADGTWRWMRSRGMPRYGPNGEIIRWYGSVEDIEERKELEATLHKCNLDLAKQNHTTNHAELRSSD